VAQELPPARVPLTGADCFLRAFDAEIRRVCGASHVSQLVLRLGPGLEAGELARLLSEVSAAQPILRAPIGRRLWLGPPVYRTGRAAHRPAPRLEVCDLPAPAAGEAPLPALFSQRLNRPLDARRGELLRLDLVRYAGGAAGADLAFSWVHMLFDGSGSEGFVRWLDQCWRGLRRPSELPQPDELAPPPSPAQSLGERGARARAWQRRAMGLGALPLCSPAGPLRRTRQELEIGFEALSEGETRRAVARASERAGVLTPMLFYLAAAIRAHHAVFRKRGAAPGSYAVPLPVNLRPKGGAGALFRTHVSLLWFQVRPEEVEDLDQLLEVLKQQRREAIRSGQVEDGVCAMDFARFAPRRLYAWLARRPLRGELCSFFFAFTGEFLPGLAHFLGAEIRGGFHVAPVPPSPGSALAFSLRAGRLGATHVRQRGVFDPDELAVFREQLRADLLGPAG
jgi:hypothetical protein